MSASPADEGNLEWQRDLSVAHTRIGNVLLRQGKRDEALAEYRAGLSIHEKLARAQPDDPQAQIDLAVSLFSLADSGESHHVYLDRPDGFAVRQRALSALGFALRPSERVYEPVSRTRDAKNIFFPHTVSIAFTQAFPDSRFENFPWRLYAELMMLVAREYLTPAIGSSVKSVLESAAIVSSTTGVTRSMKVMVRPH